jgi:hypothetical protein
MDGAIVGNTAVLFIVDDTMPFAGTSFLLPAVVNAHYVTGCVPGAFYSVATAVTPNGVAVTITPAASGVQADSTGVLSF